MEPDVPADWTRGRGRVTCVGLWRQCIRCIHWYFLLTDRNHLPLARVADAQTSVLAGGAKQAAVSVPADAVDEVRVVVHGDEGLARPHVPDYNQVITAWGEQRRFICSQTFLDF